MHPDTRNLVLRAVLAVFDQHVTATMMLDLVERLDAIPDPTTRACQPRKKKASDMTTTTWDQIRNLLDQNIKVREIADRFGISQPTVYHVKSGRRPRPAFPRSA
jgi:transcriptional regulator with PAS, ATPase and Fis domain